MQLKTTSPCNFLRLVNDGAKPRKIVFDIETGPLPDDELQALYDPSDAELPRHPGEFDPARVAVGNLKDPAKIAQKIADAQYRHTADLANYEATLTAAKQAAWDQFVAKAPLSAIYGRVLAIGYGLLDCDELHVCVDMPEAQDAAAEAGMLSRFWRIFVATRKCRGTLAGHNIAGFDLPFITRRSWKHDLRPPWVINKYGKPDEIFADTMRHWGFGNWKEHVRLDLLAQVLGVPQKLAGVTGDMFWKLLATGDYATATRYLQQDIICSTHVAKRLGLFGYEQE